MKFRNDAGRCTHKDVYAAFFVWQESVSLTPKPQFDMMCNKNVTFIKSRRGEFRNEGIGDFLHDRSRNDRRGAGGGNRSGGIAGGRGSGGTVITQ